jgi:hypothetical protein
MTPDNAFESGRADDECELPARAQEQRAPLIVNFRPLGSWVWIGTTPPYFHKY